MKLETLRDLYHEQLKDLYSAETQILQALPKMIQHASHAELKQAFEMHLEETRNQVERLNRIAQMAGMSLSGHHCKGMEGVIAEGKELLEKVGQADPDVLDAGLITAAQRVEHYEMAGYGTARAYAELLGDNEAAHILQETLDEEGDTNKKLTQLAMSVVNRDAVAA